MVLQRVGWRGTWYVYLCRAVLVWCCWANMKEMRNTHETGGLLTPRGPLCWCYTYTYTYTHAHTITHRAHTGTEQPLSCASKSPDGPSARPSAQRDAGLAVPTDLWPNSPHTPLQVVTGGSLACWRSNANRYSLLSPHFLEIKKKSLSPH